MHQPAARETKAALFIGFFALALAVRVAFVFQWDQLPYGAWPLLDGRIYDSWAATIAKGQLLRYPAFYASPLFPYLLGCVYALFGHDLLLAGLMNAFFGALTVAILVVLTEKFFGALAALLTGLLASFYLPLIFYTAPVMKEPLALLLMAAFLWFSSHALGSNKSKDYLGAGAMLGLASLVRGNAVLLAGALVFFAFLKWRKAALAGTGFLLVAMVLCILPATVHNFITSGEAIPINYADGFNLYIGHSPSANGTNQYPPEVSSDPTQEELRISWLARQELGPAAGPAAISAFWRDRALAFMVRNPARELRLLGDKMLAFWSDTEAVDNYDIGFIRAQFGTLLRWPLPSFWLLALLAAFGAVGAFRAQGEAVLFLLAATFVYMVSVVIFYVTDRYRLPAALFLLPLAGAALQAAIDLVRSRDWRRFLLAAGCSGFALWISLLPFPGAVDLTGFDWATLSTVYADLGRNQEAVDAMHEAMRLSPDNPGAQSLVRGSMAEEKLGDDGEARRLLLKAVTLYPEDGIVRYNLGRFDAGHGDLDGALQAFLRSTALAPSFTLNYYALAKVYEKLGQHETALQKINEGLAVDPYDSTLKETLAELREGR